MFLVREMVINSALASIFGISSIIKQKKMMTPQWNTFYTLVKCPPYSLSMQLPLSPSRTTWQPWYKDHSNQCRWWPSISHPLCISEQDVLEILLQHSWRAPQQLLVSLLRCLTLQFPNPLPHLGSMYTVKKNVAYFNHICRLSQLHQCSIIIRSLRNASKIGFLKFYPRASLVKLVSSFRSPSWLHSYVTKPVPEILIDKSSEKKTGLIKREASQCFDFKVFRRLVNWKHSLNFMMCTPLHMQLR